MRAGKCRVGTEICCEEIRKGKSKAILVSSALARNAFDKINTLCKVHNVKIAIIEDSQGEFGECVGRYGIKTLSIHDERFSTRIIDLLENDINSQIGGGA